MFFQEKDRPKPFRFGNSPTMVELPTAPKPIDNSISDVATREENPLPNKPRYIRAITKPFKPSQITALASVRKPASIEAEMMPYAPTSVSANANPKKPASVDVDYIPYKPLSISTGVVPNKVSSVTAGSVPNPVQIVDSVSAPRKPETIDGFIPFGVTIMETEAEIIARPASTEPGTLAFGTDTKNLYVFSETGIDSWGSFDESETQYTGALPDNVLQTEDGNFLVDEFSNNLEIEE